MVKFSRWSHEAPWKLQLETNVSTSFLQRPGKSTIPVLQRAAAVGTRFGSTKPTANQMLEIHTALFSCRTINFFNCHGGGSWPDLKKKLSIWEEKAPHLSITGTNLETDIITVHFFGPLKPSAFLALGSGLSGRCWPFDLFAIAPGLRLMYGERYGGWCDAPVTKSVASC